MFTFRCECGEAFHASEEHVGRIVKCRACGRNVNISRLPAPAATSLLPTRQSSALTKLRQSVAKPMFAVSRWFARRRASLRLLRGLAESHSSIPALLFSIVVAAVGLLLFSHDTPNTRPTDESPSVSPPTVSTSPLSTPAPSRPAPTPTPQEPAVVCAADFRPGSGDELIEGGRGGRGILIVENGTNADAVVALFDIGLKRTVRRIFVRSTETGRAFSIRPSTYRIRAAYGSRFSNETGRFCDLTGANEFDDEFLFNEYRGGDTIKFVRERITLHTVVGGNAAFHGINVAAVFADP